MWGICANIGTNDANTQKTILQGNSRIVLLENGVGYLATAVCLTVYV